MNKTIGLDLPLDLTRNKVDIDQFTRFEEKNSPLYGEAISPLYSEVSEYNNRAVFDTSGNKFHYLNGVLYKNDDEVMQTGGNKHFVRQTTNRDNYDTYDRDNNGKELYSRYENGIISYHADGNDYTYTVTDPYSAVIDARARIVNGTPIIAYIMAQSTGGYEFIYLKKDVTYNNSGVHNLKQGYLTTSQKLANATAVTGDFQQKRNVAINTTFTIKNSEEGKGFVNPLIQISNPLENVYAVSFYSNHGGKINPKDLAFWNIIDNNGVFSNNLEFNTDDGTIELVQNQIMNINFKTATEHTLSEGVVYCYPANSGWAQYDQEHAADIGKWFKTVKSDGTTDWLEDEVVFDPGYTPEYNSNVTGTYGTGTNIQSYIKYQTYNSQTYDDSITITGTCDEMYGGETNPTTIKWAYTPKLKTYNAGGDTYHGAEFNYAFLKQLLHDQKNITIPALNGTLDSGWFIPFYSSSPLGDYVSSQGLPTATFEPVEFDNTAQQYAYTRGNPVYQNLATSGVPFGETVYPAVILTKASTGHVNADGTVWNIDCFLYNNNLTPESRHIVIEAGGQTIEYDQTVFHPRHVRVTVNSEMAGQLTFPSNFQTEYSMSNQTALGKGLVYSTSNPNVNREDPTLYTGSVEMFETLEDPYVTWVDGQPQYFETVLDGETSNFTWTFTYPGNSNEYNPAVLFEHFTNKALITYKAPDEEADPATQTDYTNDFGYNYQNVSYTKDWVWTIEQEVTQIITPTAFLDDGTAISTAYAVPYNVLPTNNYMLLQARITGYENDKFNFTSIGYYNTQPRYRGSIGNKEADETEGCVMDSSIDLNMSYYRYCLHLTNRSQSIDTTTGMFIMYDSATADTYAFPGNLAIDSTGSQWITAHYYNNQGSIAKQYGKWRALINSCGLISGLSYGEDGYIGTLLTEWNSIAEDKYLYFTEDSIGYKSTDGKWYEIKLQNGDGDINIIFDRYVIVNTEGFWNCYDIERDRQLHYATDFNNRALAGVSMREWGDTGFVKIGHDNSIGRDLTQYFVSGINALYEVSQVAITSIQISPQPYLNIATGYESFIWCKSDKAYTPQYIEVFYGESTNATSAAYQYSIILYDLTDVSIVDSSLVDLNSPVAIAATTQYSPNIFTEFIHTYNNKDLIKNGNFGYPIIYNETTPILSYSSGKQISNVDSIFVIQSQFYALINGKIVSVTYDDYTIIGIDAIIDINGMVFLGYLPTAAYFWSPADRCIYTFTGDANLDVAMEANKINEVYKCYYSTMKEAIFITTDKGVYIITGKQQWHLDIVDIDNIYFLKAGYFIVESKKNNKYECTSISYEKDKLENPVKRKVVVETKYNGFGDGQVATTDRIQIVIITDDKEVGELTINSSTFTDVGFESEKKVFKITKDMWDEDNNAIVLNYSPKYQTGQGFKFKIESDFAVARMTASLNEKRQNTSTRHNQ